MPEDPLNEFFARRVDDGLFPSAAWSVSRRGTVVSEGAVGRAVVEPRPEPASVDTIYDLASLTKPLVTGLLAAIFAEKGVLGFGDPVAGFIPGFRENEEKRGMTLDDLLTHRSGFEAWRPLYLEATGDSREERLESAIRLIAKLPLEAPTGTRVVYSDINFIVLGRVIEIAGGSDLATLFHENVAGPLALKDTMFTPGDRLAPRCAASERGNGYEREMAVSRGFDVSAYSWRSEVIRGEVHDGNCLFFKGVSGHAGLFSTVRDTVKLARQFLPGSELLAEASLGAFGLDHTPGLGQARSRGFQLAATKDSSAYGVLPGRAFGHLGFTGTTLWIDPGEEAVFVALTNRTHAVEPPFADLAETRREFLSLARGLM